jgi:hypothetical protein
MNDFFEQLNKAKAGINLPASQKAGLRHKLTAYMDMHPLPTKASASHGWSNNFRKTLQIAGVSLAVVLVVGGGTTALANNALPGDALYQVKINVTEQVAAAFKFNDEARADFEIDLAARRVEEANQLQAKGELNAETEQQLAVSFEKHASQVESRIGKLKLRKNSEQAEKLAQRFIAKIQAQKGLAVNNDNKQGEGQDSPEDTASSIEPAESSSSGAHRSFRAIVKSRLEEAGKDSGNEGQDQDKGEDGNKGSDNKDGGQDQPVVIDARTHVVTTEKIEQAAKLVEQVQKQANESESVRLKFQAQLPLGKAYALLTQARFEAKNGQEQEAQATAELSMQSARNAQEILNSGSSQERPSSLLENWWQNRQEFDRK